MIFDNSQRGAVPRASETEGRCAGRGVLDTRRAIRVSVGEWRVAREQWPVACEDGVASGERILASCQWPVKTELRVARQ